MKTGVEYAVTPFNGNQNALARYFGKSGAAVTKWQRHGLPDYVCIRLHDDFDLDPRRLNSNKYPPRIFRRWGGK